MSRKWLVPLCGLDAHREVVSVDFWSQIWHTAVESDFQPEQAIQAYLNFSVNYDTYDSSRCTTHLPPACLVNSLTSSSVNAERPRDAGYISLNVVLKVGRKNLRSQLYFDRLDFQLFIRRQNRILSQLLGSEVIHASYVTRWKVIIFLLVIADRFSLLQLKHHTSENLSKSPRKPCAILMLRIAWSNYPCIIWNDKKCIK